MKNMFLFSVRAMLHHILIKNPLVYSPPPPKLKPLRLWCRGHLECENQQEGRVHEAPQAFHDKRTRPPGWHRNCFQASPRKRATICMHFFKSKHPLGSEVSWWDHRLAQTYCTDPKSSILRSQSSRRNYTREFQFTAIHLQILHQEIIILITMVKKKR